MNESWKGKHIAFLKFAATSSKKIETEWKTFFKGLLSLFFFCPVFLLKFFFLKRKRPKRTCDIVSGFMDSKKLK